VKKLFVVVIAMLFLVACATDVYWPATGNTIPVTIVIGQTTKEELIAMCGPNFGYYGAVDNNVHFREVMQYSHVINHIVTVTDETGQSMVFTLKRFRVTLYDGIITHFSSSTS
jgi:hypothetical protein